MKFSMITLGCKVNTYESEMIKENLSKENFIYEENQDRNLNTFESKKSYKPL